MDYPLLMPSVSDIRTPTTLLCGVLAVIIAGSTLLLGKVRSVHFLFAGFSGLIGVWYLTQSVLVAIETALWQSVWQTLIALLAMCLPILGILLFDAIVPQEVSRTPRLLRTALLLALPMVVLVLSPWRDTTVVRVLVFLYVFAFLTAGFYSLGQRGAKSLSRATQRRVRFLVYVGAFAGIATIAEFSWFIIPSIQIPPIGAVLSIVFLFALAQALRYERLLDASELLARLIFATALGSLIALIFYALNRWLSARFATTYVNALFALMVIFFFEPLREFVEKGLRRIFFRERFDLESSVALLRRRLIHILEVEEMGSIVMASLEQSRRITSAGLYLRDEDGIGFDRLSALGPRVPPRVEVATARAIIDRLEQGPLALEEVEREERDRKERGERPSSSDESVLAAAAVLGTLKSGVVVGIRDEAHDLIGLLVVSDDRVRDAFSPEEIALFGTVAAPIGVVVENSRAYAQMKERDRLAVLGQMAAGLAHEIRNPLGAIKGAAQLLADPPADTPMDPVSREFLGIILEEVDRLDRVVGSVLDLARPNQATVVPTDVNAVVRRTLQVLSSEPGSEDLDVELTLDPALSRVSIDPEQLRQVLMNLFRNAVQAMKGRGKVTVSTRVRFGRGTRSGPGSPATDEPFVELTVADNGPGISQKVLENLFMPFFTTKEKGTGLGLAISQRIVQGAGGRIEVRSYEGKGSTFAVILPAAMDALGTPTPAPAGVVKPS
ncbi:MAG: ATP-binding protein [Minicystis sp.]